MTPELSPTPRLLREREVAELFALTERTIRRLRTQGEIPYVRIGGSVRYRVEDIERLINPPTDAEPPEGAARAQDVDQVDAGRDVGS
jgi:excisionase family DNA binding protein